MKEKKLMGILFALFIACSMSAVNPQRIFAQTTKGIELLRSSNYVEAEKVLQEALKANPSDIQASYYLGISYLLQDKHHEALQQFLKVKADRTIKTTEPNEYQIQIALARTRLELKQADEAWKNLEAANKENASSSDVYIYRGEYYIQKEKAQEAMKELNKAKSLDPKNAYAYYYAGHAQILLGNPSKAVEEFKKFLELAPGAPEAGRAKALALNLC
jgi:tetratricopeptide (TPR) repeat protein